LIRVGNVEFGEALASALRIMVIGELGRNQKNIFFGALWPKIADLGIDVLQRQQLSAHNQAEYQPRQAAYREDDCQDEEFSIDSTHLQNAVSSTPETHMGRQIRLSISGAPWY